MIPAVNLAPSQASWLLSIHAPLLPVLELEAGEAKNYIEEVSIREKKPQPLDRSAPITRLKNPPCLNK